MNAADRAYFVGEFLDKHVHPVMLSKGKEYSRGEVDANSNFKRAALATGLTPEQACLVYLLKHLDSITHAVKTGHYTGLTEPIEERLGDAINYLLILASLIEERGIEGDSMQPILPPDLLNRG